MASIWNKSSLPPMQERHININPKGSRLQQLQGVSLKNVAGWYAPKHQWIPYFKQATSFHVVTTPNQQKWVPHDVHHGKSAQ